MTTDSGSRAPVDRTLPVEEQINQILTNGRLNNVEELDTAADALRQAVITAARALAAHRDDETIDLIALLVTALGGVETVHQDLDMRPEYEEYVRESIEQEARS